MTRPLPLGWIACGLLAIGCSDDAASKTRPVEVLDECPRVVSDADCDTSLRPIVFVHGTFGSGDNIGHVAQLFGSNGYCQDRFVAIDYNSLGTDAVPIIDALVDEVRERTGIDQVDLLGHSQGTMHCLNYLTDAERAAKVAHYVNLSGEGKVPNDVATLSISSNNDLGGIPHHAAPAEKTVTYDDEDHVDLAQSTRTFTEMYTYLIGKDPEFDEVQCGDAEITLAGVAQSFGDNTPISDGDIEVYEVAGSPWKRGKPVATLKADAQGRTETFTLRRNVAYEFKATRAGKLVGHAYYAPFKRSNHLLRFLAPSENVLVSSITTDQLRKSPAFSALVFRNAQGSFRHDLGQSLKIDGVETLGDDTAGRSTTTVGLLMCDMNQNGETELGQAFSAPFVMGTDVYVQSDEAAWVELDWNGTKLSVPNWPSDEGLVSVLLP